MRSEAEQSVDRLVKLLLMMGFIEDGQTKIEHVRIATQKNPVFGGIGGERATFGGRKRFVRGDQRVTVGKRTTCFYRIENGKPTEFHNYETKDYDGICEFIGT